MLRYGHLFGLWCALAVSGRRLGGGANHADILVKLKQVFVLIYIFIIVVNVHRTSAHSPYACHKNILHIYTYIMFRRSQPHGLYGYY